MGGGVDAKKYLYCYPGMKRDKAMAVKLMYIPNDDTQVTSSVYNNQWLKRLDTQQNEPTNLNFQKVPMVVQPTNNIIMDFGD